MALWTKPLKWVKSKIRPSRSAPPPPPVEPPKPPPRRPEEPSDDAFNRLACYYILGRLLDLGMDAGAEIGGNDTLSRVGVDFLISEIGAANAHKVLDQMLLRVRGHINGDASPFADYQDREEAWRNEAHDQIKRYTPKGQLPNYNTLMPFWWYHPSRP